MGGKTGAEKGRKIREVQISETLFNELSAALGDSLLKPSSSNCFQVDPGHVRRKFYERAQHFFGKIRAIQHRDIQSKIDMITAEVKAPWVILKKGNAEPDCTAENRFQGTISRITEGKIMTEYAVRLEDGTELCSVITRESGERLGLQKEESIWVLFNCFSVVLHLD